MHKAQIAMDDLPHAITPIRRLTETSKPGEECRKPFSWAPYVAFGIYMLVAQVILGAKTPSFAGCVLLAATLGVLVVTLAFGVQEQRNKWQAEHEPHGKSMVLLELSMYLMGLLIMCLVLWRLGH